MIRYCLNMICDKITLHILCHVMLCILSCILTNIGFSLDRKNWLITIISVKSSCQATNTPYRTWPIPGQIPPISAQLSRFCPYISRECTPHKFVPEIFILIGIPKKFYSVDLNPYRYLKNSIMEFLSLSDTTKNYVSPKILWYMLSDLFWRVLGLNWGKIRGIWAWLECNWY